jgi:hypothetical protein
MQRNSFGFRSSPSFGLTLTGLALLAFPLVLWLGGTLGGCTLGEQSGCEHLPDGFALFLTNFVFFLAFGNGIIVSGLVAIAAVVMLVLAAKLEFDSRRPRRRDSDESE